jgi:cystathionine beta-lyase
LDVLSGQIPSFGFDHAIDRRGGDSIKWNKYAGRDVLPLWIADMDFAAPPAVVAALEQRVAQGHFGYAEPWPSLVAVVLDHLQREYLWAVDASSLVWLPGLVTGLNVACRAVEGSVLTTTPVYPPFLSAPRLSGRSLLTAPLSFNQGRWTWDFPALEAALTPDTRLLLLCHPHNPVGRAWNEAELIELASFCERHNLIVCSDEIHCGLLLDGAPRHIPLAMINDQLSWRSITLMAPSKTYNIPGLGCAFAIIPDAALRRRFLAAMNGIVPHVNVLGLAACEAAYRDCDDWHKALITYLSSNRDRVEAAIAEMPGLAMTHVEATYLAWIDARALGVDDPASFFEQAGVGLSRGDDFGLPGWVRLNFACPRVTLDAALVRMHNAVKP